MERSKLQFNDLARACRTHRAGSFYFRALLVQYFAFIALMISAQTSNIARDLVNPFIGTGGHGHTFPGACVPNGMVQLSPDTRPDGVMDWDGCGGYHHSDSLVYGFSHTHLSGTGVADLCDVLLMPMSDKYSTDPVQYRTRFSHATERATPGYYRVELEGQGIDVELTATARVGVHRYTMPAGKEQFIVLDLRHRDRLIKSSIQLDGSTEIVGERRSSSWARDQHLFYCIRVSRPIALVRAASDSSKAVIAVGPDDRPLIVKVGISAVSIDGARANLDAEMPHWDFDVIKQQAEDAWNTKLSKIQIKGGSTEQRRIFYTALYHCYVAPYLFNDVDGNYRGMDGQVHHADHDVYTVFSLWDTFRGLHPLMTILEPEMTSDWIKTFLLHYQHSGRLPVWELWGNETDCMIGYHSVSVITDAYLKGIRGFDADLALGAMLASADRDEPGLNAYRTKGYISSEDQSESVSKTLEYAYNDGNIAAYCRSMGRVGRGTVERFERRARSHENLFGPGSGFYRARRNGGFIEPFDPFEVNFHFTEANAWQYSLFAPQDIEGMIALYGGKKGLEKHLDALFTANSSTSGREQADITGLIGQYAHGNEPSHHMAYLYNAVGKPEKTRAYAARIMSEQYRDAPDGLSGNEDCGQMSAWYVLSALGIYPLSPGITTTYELGHPLFDEATVTLSNGKQWSMVVDTNGNLAPPIPKDLPAHASFVPTNVDHSEIIKGGSMVLNKAREPYAVYRIPELRTEAVRQKLPCDRPGAPYITAEGAAFRHMQDVVVKGCGTCSLTIEGVDRPCTVGVPFTIDGSSTVSVEWDEAYDPVIATFTRIATNRTVTLLNEYANQYAAGGEQALVDGLRGGTDFRTGEWQGFEGCDLLATIDLGDVATVTQVGLSVLQDQRSWIWLPADVQFAFSINGRQWSTETVHHDVPMTTEEALTHEMVTPILSKKARYIKVIGRNAGPCPDWHPGKGGATWIFADEVLITTE
ncbi:MAG: GH92 family glycosyl hydrolase [Flavobacteriales bacterium]